MLSFALRKYCGCCQWHTVNQTIFNRQKTGVNLLRRQLSILDNYQISSRETTMMFKFVFYLSKVNVTRESDQFVAAGCMEIFSKPLNIIDAQNYTERHRNLLVVFSEAGRIVKNNSIDIF